MRNQEKERDNNKNRDQNKLNENQKSCTVNKEKLVLQKKINNIGNQPIWLKGRGKKIQIDKIRDEKVNIKTNISEIHWTIRE
jgi:hypothetical protein